MAVRIEGGLDHPVYLHFVEAAEALWGEACRGREVVTRTLSEAL